MSTSRWASFYSHVSWCSSLLSWWLSNPALSRRTGTANQAEGRGRDPQLVLGSRCWYGALLQLSTGPVCPLPGGGSDLRRPWKMQAEEMEVPIINNLNDNGDRLRAKGKDVFKDQQKESEVNPRGVYNRIIQFFWLRSALEVCARACVCARVCLLLGSLRPAWMSSPCSGSLSWLESIHACRQAGTPRGYFGNRLL